MLIRKIWMFGHLKRRQARGLALASWIRLWDGTVEGGLIVDAGVHLRHPPSKDWKIGSGVYLGRGVILDIWPGATLEIGSNSKIMQYTTIAAHEKVVIGQRSQIADNCTVRDNSHGIDAGADILTAPIRSGTVTIGNGAWVGRGSAVLQGAVVGDGAVVGATSTVIAKYPIGAGIIAAGSPAVRLRSRDAGQAHPQN